MINKTQFLEPLEGLGALSKLLVLDFAEIPAGTPSKCNIQAYFIACIEQGLDPRAAANRQKFNDTMLHDIGMRYLVSRYGEDRNSMLAGSLIAQEGRTLHLGVDIFAEHLEPVYAPCDGVVVCAGCEAENHSFGYYVIIQPEGVDGLYVFLGHLSSAIPAKGTKVKGGQKIASLGDYKNHENGGWSRHLHLQMFTKLPNGNGLVGYSSTEDFACASKLYPNPCDYFTCLAGIR